MGSSLKRGDSQPLFWPTCKILNCCRFLWIIQCWLNQEWNGGANGLLPASSSLETTKNHQGREGETIMSCSEKLIYLKVAGLLTASMFWS